MNTEKAHTEKLTRLSNLMLKRIEKEIEPSLEKNLARLIHLLSDIEKSNNFLLLQKAEMAFVAMTKSKPNLELAELLIEDLEDRLSVNVKVGSFLWRSLFTLNSPLSIVLFGIFVTTILGHIVVFLGYKLLEAFSVWQLDLPMQKLNFTM
jgi:hypothetical protein